MKIVFFCIPAHGHTNPTLGVVRELIARGHSVWYYSFDMMKDKIEDTGAVYVSCDEFSKTSLKPEDGAKISRDIGFSAKVIADTTLALDERVCRDMGEIKPDCIVADSMAFWGKAAALKLNIPFVSSTTTFAFNRYSSGIMKRGIKETLSMIFSMPKANREIKRLRDRGYPVNGILDIISNDNDTDTIVYTSRMFQPCSETFSDKYAFVGPSIRPSEEDFKKTKEKLIYISMGTVNNSMPELYKNCIDAFKDSKYQVVMSVGKTGCIYTDAENISVFETVDQIAVLKKADLFISHCGMNSVSESLYFGVPLLMIPQTGEQFGVALRAQQLGSGLILEEVTAKNIASMAEKILTDKSFKTNAEKISGDFKKCSGAVGAAEKIIEVCSRNKAEQA